MKLLTYISADIKTLVDACDLGAFTLFEGPNASGKSAKLQAIDLLINGQVGDLRGKDRSADYFVRSLKSRASTGEGAAIRIDGALVDDDGHGLASSISCVAAVGRTVTSAQEGLFDDKTDLWRLTHEKFVEASPDSMPVAWLKALGFNVGLVEAIEELTASVDKAKKEIKTLTEDREVFRKYKLFDRVGSIDMQLEAKEAAVKAVAARLKPLAEQANQEARRLAVALDASSPRMARMEERFGAPKVGPEKPGFGKGQAWPALCIDKSRLESAKGSEEVVDFALSGAEEVFATLWLANAIALSSESGAYRMFLAPDRDYDDDFIRRLRDDCFNLHQEGKLGMQVFIAKSAYKE